jgi:alpha-L-rhamnosidase
MLVGALAMAAAVTAQPGKPMSKILSFQHGQPVWPKGRETEKNLFVGFRCAFAAPDGGSTRLCLTASTLYRAFLNGEFLAHGPARAGHGWYRVDEIDLTERLKPGENVLAIEVAGYNANSYYLLDQPSFLQAEIRHNGKALIGTGDEGFVGTILPQRIQKVQRYSFQRPFSEFYRLDPSSDSWRTGGELTPAELTVTEPKQLISRHLPLPDYDLRQPVGVCASGTLKRVTPKHLWQDRSLLHVGPKLGGYPKDQLDLIASEELQHVATDTKTDSDTAYDPTQKLPVAPMTFQTLDLGQDLTGFIGAEVVCHTAGRLYLTFDEILLGGDVNFHRMGTVNAVGYDLVPGTYRVESFEPYTLRYLKALAVSGQFEIKGVYLRELACPGVWEASFSCSDPVLNGMFEAARDTFRQNTLDIYMDCPSRERAGWLCDSFFTARVEKLLTGKSAVERNFFENFLLPKRFPHLPEGMLPMCYPADHNDGVFIPNWSLWFVIELEEYLARTGDRALVDALEPRLDALLRYFAPFRNEDGLLEKLQSWVFVEWSKANSFTQDVNYPSNMLYASVLDAMSRLYDRPRLHAEAEAIRQTIRTQSFDGEFFVDNAVRKDGKLVVTRNRTEVCQYFAFFFGVATPETHAQLWERLRDQFGPQRAQTKAFPEIHPANAFVGNYLRLELLSRYGQPDQVLNEMRGFFRHMVTRTGTLWENMDERASCNHGFASHVAWALVRDALGIAEIDAVHRTIRLKAPARQLAWCRARLPVPGGFLRIEQQDGKIRVAVPAGYRVEDR